MADKGAKYLTSETTGAWTVNILTIVIYAKLQ